MNKNIVIAVGSAVGVAVTVGLTRFFLKKKAKMILEEIPSKPTLTEEDIRLEREKKEVEIKERVKKTYDPLKEKSEEMLNKLNEEVVIEEIKTEGEK